MPHQNGDPPFGPAERLFRRVPASAALPDGTVTPDGVHDVPPGASVDRELLSTAESSYALAMAHARNPTVEIVIAEIAFADIPDTFSEEGVETVCESVVAYLPVDRPASDTRPAYKNPAHSEIQVRKLGETESAEKIGSPALKAKIRSEIAARMRVVYPRR